VCVCVSPTDNYNGPFDSHLFLIHLILGSHLTLSVRIPPPALPRIPYLTL